MKKTIEKFVEALNKKSNYFKKIGNKHGFWIYCYLEILWRDFILIASASPNKITNINLIVKFFIEIYYNK